MAFTSDNSVTTTTENSGDFFVGAVANFHSKETKIVDDATSATTFDTTAGETYFTTDTSLGLIFYF
jgi:hypothetical protein